MAFFEILIIIAALGYIVPAIFKVADLLKKPAPPLRSLSPRRVAPQTSFVSFEVRRNLV